MLLQNTIKSSYFQKCCRDLTDWNTLVDEIYYKVTHLEPWAVGTFPPSFLFALIGFGCTILARFIFISRTHQTSCDPQPGKWYANKCWSTINIPPGRSNLSGTWGVPGGWVLKMVNRKVVRNRSILKIRCKCPTPDSHLVINRFPLFHHHIQDQTVSRPKLFVCCCGYWLWGVPRNRCNCY